MFIRAVKATGRAVTQRNKVVLFIVVVLCHPTLFHQAITEKCERKKKKKGKNNTACFKKSSDKSVYQDEWRIIKVL